MVVQKPVPGVGDGQEGWCVAPHGVTKSRTRLSDWTEMNWTELRFVIAFLPRSTHLLISWLQSLSIVKENEVWEPRKWCINAFTFPPSICHEVMGLDAVILVFWMLSFKPTFSLFSFTFIKRFFSSSLSTIRVVSSAYLRLLRFLLAILIPACASSSPAFSWCTLHIS